MPRGPVATRECGACGEIRRIAVRARDGQPDMCDRCAPRPTAPCGVCGVVSRIVVSATADRAGIGSCCFRMPVATCSKCGRRRRCAHARTDRPMWSMFRAPR